MRWRWSSELPVIEQSAEVGRPIDEVYAEFRGDAAHPIEILLVEDDAPRLLVWELDMRGLRGARLTVALEPRDPNRTLVTARLEARVVGRLRVQRARLAEGYGLVVADMLSRRCADLEAPGSDSAAEPETGADQPEEGVH